MLELLDYGFMRRALVAAVLVGTIAPLVGVFVVQRRMSLIGDGMGHVALTGVAVGLLTGAAPVWTALVAAVAAAVLLEAVRATGRTGGDLALALLFYSGIAGGVVLVSLTPNGGAANLVAYLFGSVTTTTWADLAVFAGLAVIVLLILAVWGRVLYAVSEDEEFAMAIGLPVRLVNTLLLVLVATTVVLSMRVVGLLLISALMVVPVATARLFARSFVRTLLLASVIGAVVAVLGTAGSYYTATPSGGSIVLLAVATFLLAAAAVLVARRAAAWRRRRAHPDAHAHVHGGPNCEHPAVAHADHVDYLHDGHRHSPRLTPTGVDYDEH